MMSNTRTERIPATVCQIEQGETIARTEVDNGEVVLTIVAEISEEVRGQSYQRGDFTRTVNRLRKKYGSLHQTLQDDPDPRIRELLDD